MSEIDKYYQILRLNPGASEEEIKEAYKDLVKVWHPDRFSDDPNIQKIATEKIKEIDEAFKQLLIWAGGPPQKEKEIPEPQLEVRTERPETSGSIIIQTKSEDAVIVIKVLSVGGSAVIEVDDEYPVLQHFPSCDRPRGRLPWPLSKFQPFRFTIRLCKRTKGEVICGIEFPTPLDVDKKSEPIIFDHSQVEEGLNLFLSGARPDGEVSIRYLPDL